MQWCIILEDYVPELIYIPGNTNVVADMLRCLDNNNSSKSLSIDNKLFLLAKALTTNNIKELGNKEINLLSEESDDITIVEYYIDKEDSTISLHSYPLNFKIIQKEQQTDNAFLEPLKKLNTKYAVKIFQRGDKSRSLICQEG
eukprot:12587643-Ditylum_brightwellii.AAC.1